jgi:hypothetical protein
MWSKPKIGRYPFLIICRLLIISLNRKQKLKAASKTMKVHTSATNEVNDSSSSTIPMGAFDFAAYIHAFDGETTLKRCIKVRTLKESLTPQQQQPPHIHVKQQIRFSTIEIRDYPRILGDNPSTTQGPPLTIDWIPMRSCSLSIDEYEQSRPPRRQKDKMIVPKSIRMDWLREEGYSRGELKEAELVVVKARKGREASSKQSVKLAESKEALSRKFQKWFFHKPSAKVLYEDWLEQQQHERFDDDTWETQSTVVSRVA